MSDKKTILLDQNTRFYRTADSQVIVKSGDTAFTLDPSDNVDLCRWFLIRKVAGDAVKWLRDKEVTEAELQAEIDRRIEQWQSAYNEALAD